MSYSMPCVKRPLSKGPKIGFQDQLSLNAGQKYCRMLQGEHSAILSTFIKLPFVIKIFVLSIFEWPFYTGLLFIVVLLTQTSDTCKVKEKTLVNFKYRSYPLSCHYFVCPKSICFLRLLHTFKCTLDKILSYRSNQYEPWSDLVWAHIVCNIS